MKKEKVLKPDKGFYFPEPCLGCEQSCKKQLNVCFENDSKTKIYCNKNKKK